MGDIFGMSFDENLVVKSNDLIEGRYKMSAIAQKLAASIISMVDPLSADTHLPVFELTMSQLAVIMEIDVSNARKRLEPAMEELKSINIKVRPTDNEETFIILSLFRVCGYIAEEGYAKFEFESRLDPYVRYLANNFTQYQVKQIRALRSMYSIRLYEILRKAHPMKCKRGQSFVTYTLPDLRAMLGIKKKSCYEKYNTFKHKVLEKARTELANETDLAFSYTSQRRGKSIYSVRFCTHHNENFQSVASSIIEGEVVPKVCEAQFSQLRAAIPALSEKETAYLVANFERDRLAEAGMSYMQAAMSGTKIEKPGAYLFAILRNQRREDDQWKSQQPTNYSTEEALDTSWADNFQFQFEDDA